MENLFKLDSKESIIEEIKNKYQKILLQPYHHIDENKGKGFRNTIIQTYNFLINLDGDHIELITKLIQWGHTSSLMVDDIQDSSELRRGNPAAHVIYGVGRTVTAVDICDEGFLYRKVNALNCFLKLWQGQIMDIYWRDNFICPSEDDYLDMVTKKTGQLFFVISTFMQFYSKSKDKVNFNKLSILISLYFQITDDYKGLKSKLYCESKGFCDDIREGKFTFPIIHAINSHPNDKRILDILKMRTTNVDLKIKCLELLEEFGSMEYTRNKLTYYKNLITKEMKQLGFTDHHEAIFKIQDFDV